MSYPEGWATQAATEPWTDTTFPFSFEIPQADFLHGPGGFNLNLVFASRPLGDSTPEDWVAEQMAGPEGCPTTEPITIDGATGLIGAGGLVVGGLAAVFLEPLVVVEAFGLAAFEEGFG